MNTTDKTLEDLMPGYSDYLTEDKLTNNELYGLLHSGLFRTCDTLHEAYELMDAEISKVPDQGDQIYLRMALQTLNNTIASKLILEDK